MRTLLVAYCRIHKQESLLVFWESSSRCEKLPGPPVIGIASECGKPVALHIVGFSVRESCSLGARHSE